MYCPQDKQPVVVVSACMRADGCPDFAIHEVEVTPVERDNGIHVNIVAPGWFDSPLADSWKNDPVLAAAITGHTAQRRWGATTDLAGAYQFLASDASAFVTGTVLSVDGGYLLA